MIFPALVALALSQGTPVSTPATLPPVDPNAPLPPGHPTMGGQSPSLGPVDPNAPLPPGHPAMGGQAPALGPVDPNAPLPPGHPGTAAPTDLPQGHPQVAAGQKPLSSSDLIKKLDGTPDLKSKEKTFEVAAALGKLYYANGRYPESAIYLKQALGKSEPARGLLFDARKRNAAHAVKSASEVGCGPSPQSTVDSLTGIARAKLTAGDAAAAEACASSALEPTGEVERILANALFLTGDPAAALAELDRAIAVDARDADAAFLRGAVRLDAHGDDLKQLSQAKADLSRSVELAPGGPRAPFAREMVAHVDKALAAGGLGKLDAQLQKEARARPIPAASSQGMPVLSKDQIDAVQNTERTPEMDQGFAQLVEQGEDQLAHKHFQDALDLYKRVVPFQQENGRAKAGMAWAMVGLGKPAADRIWMVAIQADVAAVDHLGDTLKAKGDLQGARDLWAKLLQSAPDYAARTGLASKVQ